VRGACVRSVQRGPTGVGTQAGRVPLPHRAAPSPAHVASLTTSQKRQVVSTLNESVPAATHKVRPLIFL